MVDTEHVVHALRGSCEMKVFPNVVSHCRETRAAGAVFHNGKMVISGAATEAHALSTAHLLVARLARDLNRPDFHLRNFKITNIVSVAYLGFELNLHMLLEDMGDTVNWTPDKFVGARVPIAQGITFVAFESGKVLSLGQSSLAQCAEAESHLAIFDRYRLGHEHRAISAEERALQVRKRAPGQRVVVDERESAEQELWSLVHHLSSVLRVFEPDFE